MSAAQTGASQAMYQVEGMLLALGLRAVLSALPLIHSDFALELIDLFPCLT